MRINNTAIRKLMDKTPCCLYYCCKVYHGRYGTTGTDRYNVPVKNQPLFVR